MSAAFSPYLRTLIALGVLVLVAACADPKQRAVETLKRNDVAQLRRDAALLYKDLFAAHRDPFISIRSRSWPASFKACQPIRVGAYRDGISLALKATSTAEWGLYIVPWQMDVVPSDKPGASFEPLADGIYWYSFGD